MFRAILSPEVSTGKQAVPAPSKRLDQLRGADPSTTRAATAAAAESRE